MIVGAAYALNLSVFAVFGIETTGIWLDVVVALLAAVMSYRLTRVGEPELKPFFVLLVLALLFNLANLLVWNTGWTVADSAWSSTQGSNEFPLYYGFLALFLFFWDCAWLYLTVTLIRRQGFGLANWIALIVLLGFVAAYVAQYREFGFQELDAEHRVLSLLFVLELVGILLGVMCTLLGAARPYLFMVVGFSLFASIHIVGIHLLLQGQTYESQTLQPLWTMGRAFVFAGIWLLLPPRVKTKAGSAGSPGDAMQTVPLVERGRQYSQLSSLLIVFTLGAVFVVAAFERMLVGSPGNDGGQSAPWFAMFFVLFCVGCAIFMSFATSRFDRAVSYVREHIADIFDSKLANIGAVDGDGGMPRTLKLAGLDSMLAESRRGAAQLRDDVIVLGPERLNRPAGQYLAGPEPSCFIVMPFGAPWSPGVNRLIREACTGCGVNAVRGDDIFSPTDILDDIWRQIVTADFVIADVTGRNTNVFYELGMAHAVGKPVIILAQSEDDVPIDLKTRRWLPYDPEQADALAAALRQSIGQVLDMYRLRAPAGAKAGSDSNEQHPG